MKGRTRVRMRMEGQRGRMSHRIRRRRNWREKEEESGKRPKVNKIHYQRTLDPSHCQKKSLLKMLTLWNISLRSCLGLTHEAMASQKKMKSSTTPPGFTLIMLHTPLKAESFSSLSRMLRREMHLQGGWGFSGKGAPHDIFAAMTSRSRTAVVGGHLRGRGGWEDSRERERKRKKDGWLKGSGLCQVPKYTQCRLRPNLKRHGSFWLKCLTLIGSTKVSIKPAFRKAPPE